MKRLKNLIDCVQIWHYGQVRKYTGEPYFNHLINVMKGVEHLQDEYPFICEIAICHDLYEDTDVGFGDLHVKLCNLGYSHHEGMLITRGVRELTDIYTPENFPEFNRAERKAMECRRLAKITPTSQTVKYADLMDNSKSILERDPGFAKTYIPEKEAILDIMDKGDKELYKRCIEMVFAL